MSIVIVISADVLHITAFAHGLGGKFWGDTQIKICIVKRFASCGIQRISEILILIVLKFRQVPRRFCQVFQIIEFVIGVVNRCSTTRVVSMF